MAITTVLREGPISVIDYRCSAGPADAPFVERHRGFSVSYVRKGSFGYVTRGESFELVAGSIMVGHPDDEYLCTHEHSQGDECLSFQLAPELVDAAGDRPEVWRTGCVPPRPDLMALGELAQAAAESRSDVGLDELGMLLTARLVDTVTGRHRPPASIRGRDRRRAVEAASWLDAHSHERVDLAAAASEVPKASPTEIPNRAEGRWRREGPSRYARCTTSRRHCRRARRS